MHEQRVVKVPGTLEAVSPIQHGGDEKTGSTPVLRSITAWDPDAATHVRLPFLSGNAIRGVLRRLVFRDLLDRLSIKPRDIGAKLHHALFSGGVLEGADDATGKVELELRRKLRDAVPPLGLVGCSLANQMVPGSLVVQHAIPVCRESSAYLPDSLRSDPRAQHSVRTFTDVSFATRRDELREERATDEQAVQMKVDFEAFITGTLFWHGFALRYPSELEVSCLGHTIALWAEQPYIGGKASSGYGEVKLDYDGVPDPQPYIAYLTAEAESVRAALGEMTSVLGSG